MKNFIFFSSLNLLFFSIFAFQSFRISSIQSDSDRWYEDYCLIKKELKEQEEKYDRLNQAYSDVWRAFGKLHYEKKAKSSSDMHNPHSE